MNPLQKEINFLKKMYRRLKTFDEFLTVGRDMVNDGIISRAAFVVVKDEIEQSNLNIRTKISSSLKKATGKLPKSSPRRRTMISCEDTDSPRNSTRTAPKREVDPCSHGGRGGNSGC